MRRKKKNANKSINLQVLPLVHPNAARCPPGNTRRQKQVVVDRDLVMK